MRTSHSPHPKDAFDNLLDSLMFRLIVIALTAIYLLNPTGGFDLLPDNLPILGNLDEILATIILMKFLEAGL